MAVRDPNGLHNLCCRACWSRLRPWAGSHVLPVGASRQQYGRLDFLGDSRDVRHCDWAYRYCDLGQRLDRISGGFAGSLHIVTVYRTMAGYPEPHRSEFTRSILAYTRSVIEIAWPAQRRGEVSEKGTEILLSLGVRLLAFELTPGAQSYRSCGGSQGFQHAR